MDVKKKFAFSEKDRPADFSFFFFHLQLNVQCKFTLFDCHHGCDISQGKIEGHK